MSLVTLDACGCVIDNGEDGETFTMIAPCPLHSDPRDAIAEARALTVAMAQAMADGKEGVVERAEDGTMRIVAAEAVRGQERPVHASCAPLRSRAAFAAAIAPLNTRLKAQGR